MQRDARSQRRGKRAGEEEPLVEDGVRGTAVERPLHVPRQVFGADQLGRAAAAAALPPKRVREVEAIFLCPRFPQLMS